MATTLDISVYHQTTRVARITADPRTAWKAAVAYVRAGAHSEGTTGLNDGWYRTANRVGYMRGAFRCTPTFAEVRPRV